MSFALDKMQIDDALGLNTYQMPAGTPNPGERFGAPALGAPQAQQPMAGRFGGVAPNMGAQVGPLHVQTTANLGPSLAFQGGQGTVSAPVAGGQLDINANVNPLFRLAQLGAKYGQGPVSGGVQYTPGQGVGGNVQYTNGPFSANATYVPGQGAGGGVQYSNDGLTAGAGLDPRLGAYDRVGLVRRFEEGGLATSIPAPQDYHQRDVDFINTQDQHMRELAGKRAYTVGGFAVK